jgi:hypothetical protein
MRYRWVEGGGAAIASPPSGQHLLLHVSSRTHQVPGLGRDAPVGHAVEQRVRVRDTSVLVPQRLELLGRDPPAASPAPVGQERAQHGRYAHGPYPQGHLCDVVARGHAVGIARIPCCEGYDATVPQGRGGKCGPGDKRSEPKSIWMNNTLSVLYGEVNLGNVRELPKRKIAAIAVHLPRFFRKKGGTFSRAITQKPLLVQSISAHYHNLIDI